jgi:hypothetical protein
MAEPGNPAPENSVPRQDLRTSTGSLADLARAGFEIARQRMTTVDFEVHHVAARNGYLRSLVSSGIQPLDKDNVRRPGDPAFLETLSSTANGGGVAIGTHTRGAAENLTGDELRGERNHVAYPDQTPDGWVFHDTGWPNPTFIYESARTFEGLIEIDRAAGGLRNWHSAVVRDLLDEISDIATNLAQAPLLTLQCPAQLPTTMRTRNHDLRTRRESPAFGTSLAVRFSIALRDASARRQIALGNRIRELCDEYGFSLWIGDFRPGHRPGNWFEVCRQEEDPAVVTDACPAPEQRLTTCLPVTCAGPARIGSTHSIMTLLRRYPAVGVAACSGTALNDLSFIHLQLSIQDVDAVRLNRILEKLLGSGTVPTRPSALLEALFDRLGLRKERARPEVTGPASDYQTFVGPAFDYQPVDAAESMAVWFSWQIARKEDALAAPIECLYRAMEQVVPKVTVESGLMLPLSQATSVEYLVCRATEQSVVRGKGKLAMPRTALDWFAGKKVQEPISTLCQALEEAWKVQVDLADVRSVSELTVAWRESWLGHWSYV